MHELEVEWGSSSSSKAPGPRMRASKRSPASAWHASTSRWHAGGGRGDETKRAHGVTFNHNPLLDKGLPVWRLFAAGAARLFGCADWTGGLSAGEGRFSAGQGRFRYARVIEMPATRGRIMDRNGDVLAVSTPVARCGDSRRRQVAASAGSLARRLAGPLDVRELNRKLASREGFCLPEAAIAPEVAQKVAEPKLPGIHLQQEYRRYYPGGEVTAMCWASPMSTIMARRASSSPSTASRWASRITARDQGPPRSDHRGRGVDPPPRRRGDVTPRSTARSSTWPITALRDVVRNTRPAASAVVLDARTGEVLALVNNPVFNPTTANSPARSFATAPSPTPMSRVPR